MSQENMEMVRRAWEAWESGDIATAFADLSPDLVTVIYPPLPLAGTYHGPEGFLQSAVEWAESFNDLVMTPEEFFDAGDHVVVHTLHKSRGAESGVPVETDIWYIYTFLAGKMVRVTVFNDRADALEAVGLSS
jgi:ketosteroid isomerase-like protein